MGKVVGARAQHSEPIFIVGVPRSGTTLLRVILDSHSRIACGPEAPWLARSDHSIKNLYQFMAQDPLGYVRSYGLSGGALKRQVADWVDGLFMEYALSKGKVRWAEKTPDHSLEIPFLSELFPEACFLHLVRDGRDVACSTAILSDERKAISEWHSQNLLLDDTQIVPNTVQNAALRWKLWTGRVEKALEGKRYLCLRYEDLVLSPEREVRRMMDVLGEKFEPAMLDYHRFEHDCPDWEWGTRDVKRARSLTDRSVGRWKEQLSPEVVLEMEETIGEALQRYQYSLSTAAVEET